MDYKNNALRFAGPLCAGLLIGGAWLAPEAAAPSPRAALWAALAGVCGALGLYGLLRRRARGAGGAVVCVALAVAALFAASVPLPKVYPELTIQATGQKNPRSHSSEVFVRLLSPPVPGLADSSGEHWEKRGEVFVSYRQQPSTLSYRGAWGADARLRLVRHPYSGIAEVRIAGAAVQRLDLFAEKEGYIDVALPGPRASWTGYARRGAAFAALGLALMAAAQGMAALSRPWRAGCLALVLAATATASWVRDISYMGALEIVAFGSSGAPARVDMDAGHGFTRELTVPVHGGAARLTDFAGRDVRDATLRADGGALIPFHAEAPAGAASACYERDGATCLFEVRGAGPVRLWLEGEGGAYPVGLPEPVDGSRLFVLVERQQDRLTVSVSRAYVQLSAWEHVSRRIEALRLSDAAGQPAQRLARILSDGSDSYRMFAAGARPGEYRVPAMYRPDSASFTGMKVFAVLIVCSVLLLLFAAVRIGVVLRYCYRQGQRWNVTLSLFGCLLWLGGALLVGWPGVMGWDGLSPYIQAETGQIMLWYGIGYPLIVGGFLLLGPGWLITLWSALATACLLLGTAALLLRQGSARVRRLAPVLLLCALPLTAIPVAMMTHLRDALNGLVLVLFTVASFYAALRWPTWPAAGRKVAAALLLAAGVVIVLLRVDNLSMLLVLMAGLVLRVCGWRASSAGAIAVAALCWLSVSPIVERAVMPDATAAAQEKSAYAATAVINPLAGMLVYGQRSLPPALQMQLRATLDQVLDVAVAEKKWTPYNIIYWHEARREHVTPETNRRLRELYVRTFLADPLLFLQLRLATFGSSIGHAWFAPPNYDPGKGSGNVDFHDHLLTQDANWSHLTQVAGFAAPAHPFSSHTRELLDWSVRVASSLLQLPICVVLVLLYKQNPLTGIVAISELARTALFFLLEPASIFLYLYDLHLLGFLLPLLALVERSLPRQALRNASEGAQA